MQYVISFLEGIITFISPCLLPMLPIYVSYFAGGGERSVRRTLLAAAGFVLGFTLVFVALAAVNIVSGLVVIFFGLSYLGVFKTTLFRGGSMAVNASATGFFRAMLFGIIFSVGWTPCVGASSAQPSCWPRSEGTCSRA